MSKPIVYVSLPISQKAEQIIAEHCEYRVWTEPYQIPRERLISELKDADGLLTTRHLINQELMDAAPKLRAVSNMSVGYNNFDLSDMKQRGIIGTHTPYVLDETVADLIFALMLAAARRIPELDLLVKQGRWEKGNDSAYFGIDVHHSVLGIIGMGRVGEAVARRARLGFQMEVQYFNRSRRTDTERELDARYTELDQLMKTSDFVLLMTPLTEQTVKLMDREQFKLMKKEAIFINASRGETVNEEALVEALRTGEIRAAGLDVFCEEPLPAGHPLLELPNAVTVPHIGSATSKTRSDMAVLAARNLIQALQGKGEPFIVPELRS